MDLTEDKKEKERERKRRYYERNKEKIKEKAKKNRSDCDNQTDEKKASSEGSFFNFGEIELLERSGNIIKNMPFLLYCTVSLACTSMLIFLTAKALGRNFTAYVFALLLEIGIATLALVKFQNKYETIFAKVFCLLFSCLSLLILKEGAFSNPGNDIRAMIAKSLVENVEKMPENHTTSRRKSLEKASKLVETTAEGASKTSNWINFGLRIFLFVENYFFARLAMLRKWYN